MGDRELGGYLKLLRIKNSLTMTQTADVTGVTQGYISQIENGIYTPSAKTLAKLARAYSVPEIHLLRKAGIVQLSSSIPSQADLTKEIRSNIFADEPLAEISDSRELLELLNRGLHSLEYLTDQFRQRGQLAHLPAAPSALESAEPKLSAEISLPVYDAQWQPQANAAGEAAALALPAHMCADDPDAFVLMVGDAAMEPRIQLGDWVIISPASELKSGDIVAINDRNLIQLRQYTLTGNTHAFIPFNPEFAHRALIVDGVNEKVEVVGHALRVVNRQL